MPRVLDVGCGRNKHPGAIGVDRNPDTDADLLCDLNRTSYPFRDSSFDEIRAVHVVEHVEDVIGFMEEMHRLLRPAGRLYLVTPHFSDYSSYCDPTHRRHLSSFSFTYFTEPRSFGFYSAVRFRERSVRLQLLRVWRWLGFEWLVNHWRAFRRFWEHYLCFVIRGKSVTFELEAMK